MFIFFYDTIIFSAPSLFTNYFLIKVIKMEKRHQDQLTTRLEDAFLNGMSHITWEELYHWYQVEKIAAGTRRDIETRWQDLTENELGRLKQIDGRGGIYIFGEKSIENVDQKNTLDKL